MPKYELELDYPEIRNLITDCFVKDMWTVREACRLLAGFLPQPIAPIGFFTLDGMPLDGSPESSEMMDLEIRLSKIWKSNPSNPELATPEQFINWAVSKGFSPVWLDAVKEKGFYLDKSVKKLAIKTTGNTHPPLDWQQSAREIADELFDKDTSNETRDNLYNYAKRVMEEMRKRKIHGPRGPHTNPMTIQREALQAGKWWAKKQK